MPVSTRRTNRSTPPSSNTIFPIMSDQGEPTNLGDRHSSVSHHSSRHPSPEREALLRTVQQLQERLASLEARRSTASSTANDRRGANLITLEEEANEREADVEPITSTTPIARRSRHVGRDPEDDEDDDEHESHGGGAKINKPEPFKGDARSVRDFLTSCEMFTNMQPKAYRPDHKRIIFAGSFFRERAQTWWTTMYGLHPKPAWMYDWDEFCTEVHRMFGRTDMAEQSARQLRNLRQTGSASEYYTRFLQLSLDAGWNERANISAFKEGLKNSVQLAIASMPMEPESLVELANVAVRIDNQQHEQREKIFPRRTERDVVVFSTDRRAAKPRTDHHRTRSNPQSTPAPHSNSPSRSFTPRYSTPRANLPNNASRAPSRAPLSAEERDKRAREGRCFECGLQGHVASDCPKRKPLPAFRRPMIQAVTTKGEPSQGESLALAKK